ncbi:MAG: preprotein translocase subunit SecG [Chlamydiia bacterium]|nr:preprotein translocase subunit SecG [Chlamydiia bacterium]
MSFIYFLALGLFVLMSVVLCFSILIQEGKSAGGLGAIGAGADSGDSLFGTSTPEVLRRFSGWMVLVFFLSCVFLSLWTSAFERTRGGTPHYTIEDIKER